MARLLLCVTTKSRITSLVGPGMSIEAITFIAAAVMLAAWAIGRWMGLANKGGDRPSKFDDASMALLGLLLAFAFGISITRHDQRRLAVVADSNAIGDFYTCASLLKEPTRTRLQDVIRRYVQLRLELAHGPLTDSDLERALGLFGELHNQMTALVSQALNEGTPIAVSLTNTLNAVTSNQALRLSAYRERLPTSIILLLCISAVVTSLLIGREQGIARTSDITGTLCFVLVVSVAIYVTLDLNQPGHGFERVSQEPIQRLIAAMK